MPQYRLFGSAKVQRRIGKSKFNNKNYDRYNRHIAFWLPYSNTIETRDPTFSSKSWRWNPLFSKPPAVAKKAGDGAEADLLLEKENIDKPSKSPFEKGDLVATLLGWY